MEGSVELRAVRQLNGDLRIDDAGDDAPMLKVEFCNEWAKALSDEEKEEILEVVVEKMAEFFQDRANEPQGA